MSTAGGVIPCTNGSGAYPQDIQADPLSASACVSSAASITAAGASTGARRKRRASDKGMLRGLDPLPLELIELDEIAHASDAHG